AGASGSRTASRWLSSGLDVLQGVLGAGVAPVLRELDRVLDDPRHLAVDLLELVVGEAEPPAQLVDRVLRLAQARELVLRPVDLRVADVVADEAVGLAEEEERAAAAARVLEGLHRAGVD